MFLPRPDRRVASLFRLYATLSLFALALSTAAQAPAQTPTQTPDTPTPAPVYVPKPTKAPTDTLPSMPAPTRIPDPSKTPPPPQSPTDPLQQPIIVPPGPDATPQPFPRPTKGRIEVAMPAYQLLPGVHLGFDHLGSTYIPVDSPVYAMALRLYSMGYLDTAFINMRPWSRRSLLHMLQASSPSITASGNDEAMDILAKLNIYLSSETPANGDDRRTVYGFDTAYIRFMGISGQTLRDSYHLGQTIANDYGRPYQAGFNDITGFSSVNEMGRFSLYVRGEYQHSPSGTGYSIPLTSQLSSIDEINYGGQNAFGGPNLWQGTIPTGPIAAQNPFRLQEANLSYHILGHEISAGKSDAWLGPGLGGAMAWSNNAENIYSFRINRIEPMHVPLLSKLIGPIRYDFFVGSLKGHSYPNDPWIHSEIISAAPSPNFQFAFQRSVIWGGEGHVPINLHTFFRSFFNFNDTTGAQKSSNLDPGARYSNFSFSYRLPFVRNYLTLYADSIAHDDVTPISAPRRAAYRPGLYLSQFPFKGLHKLDLRIEAASTDTSTLRSLNGQFNYFEIVQRQGYTNKGFIMGDWIGREAKGGQAWLTYHLSANEWIQIEYLDKKTPKDFIPGGTTQGQFKAEVIKRFRKEKDIELDAWLQYEKWKAPIYIANPGNAANSDTTIAFQVTFFPKLHSRADIFSSK